MVLNETDTPQPGDEFPLARAPLLLTVPDWFDISANSNETGIFDIDEFNGQLMDVKAVGGRPEQDVDVEIAGEISLEKTGPEEKRQTHDADAIADFNDPVPGGLLSTDSFTWSVFNRSGTNFTAAQAGQDPYQTYLTYEIRNLTILEKLQHDIPLTSGPEQRIANQILTGQNFSLTERDQLNLPITELDPVFKPSLEGKNVLEDDVTTRTLDVNSGEQQTVIQETVRKEAGVPQDVIYLTGLAINGLEYGSADALEVHISTRTNEFFIMETFGLPGIKDAGGIQGNRQGNTFPGFVAPMHIPFLDQMQVWLESANDITNVDVQVAFSRVDRTLVEKALYDLESEIEAPENVSRKRRNEIVRIKEELFDQIQTKLQAGVPITAERRESQEVSAP